MDVEQHVGMIILWFDMNSGSPTMSWLWKMFSFCAVEFCGVDLGELLLCLVMVFTLFMLFLSVDGVISSK